MRQELDDLLCERYPDIFRNRHGDSALTAMCWGFACGDGWYSLIDDLCRDLTAAVEAGTKPPVTAFQVKQKFGILRFRASGDEAAQALCRAAEDRSAHICEECGQPGIICALNCVWQVLCPEHTVKIRKQLGHESSVYDYIQQSEIRRALQTPRYAVLSKFAQIFSLATVREEWEKLEAEGAVSLSVIQQARAALGTIEGKLNAKKAAWE